MGGLQPPQPPPPGYAPAILRKSAYLEMLSENRVIPVTYFNIYTHKFKNFRKNTLFDAHLTKYLIKKDKILHLKIGGDFDRNGGEAGIDPNRRRKPPIGGGMGTLVQTDQIYQMTAAESRLLSCQSVLKYVVIFVKKIENTPKI